MAARKRTKCLLCSDPLGSNTLYCDTCVRDSAELLSVAKQYPKVKSFLRRLRADARKREKEQQKQKRVD